MATSKTHQVFPTQQEIERLIAETHATGRVLELTFGPSSSWIEWNDGDEIPWTVMKIAAWRGVLNENTNGDGI